MRQPNGFGEGSAEVASRAYAGAAFFTIVNGIVRTIMYIVLYMFLSPGIFRFLLDVVATIWGTRG